MHTYLEEIRINLSVNEFLAPHLEKIGITRTVNKFLKVNIQKKLG